MIRSAKYRVAASAGDDIIVFEDNELVLELDCVDGRHRERVWSIVLARGAIRCVWAEYFWDPVTLVECPPTKEEP